MTCRDCKLWDIESDKDKAGRVRKDWHTKCLWVSKEQYPLSVQTWAVRPTAGSMGANDGDGCPCFQKRDT